VTRAPAASDLRENLGVKFGNEISCDDVFPLKVYWLERTGDAADLFPRSSGQQEVCNRGRITRNLFPFRSVLVGVLYELATDPCTRPRFGGVFALAENTLRRALAPLAPLE